MGAGKYNQAFTWKLRSATRESTLNQAVETFTDNGTLWGELTPIIGQEGEEYGTPQGTSDATVTLRQYPSVSNLDRLLHKRFNELYVITGVHRGNNETILDVKRYEDLTLVDQ